MKLLGIFSLLFRLVIMFISTKIIRIRYSSFIKQNFSKSLSMYLIRNEYLSLRNRSTPMIKSGHTKCISDKNCKILHQKCFLSLNDDIASPEIDNPGIYFVMQLSIKFKKVNPPMCVDLFTIHFFISIFVLLK